MVPIHVLDMPLSQHIMMSPRPKGVRTVFLRLSGDLVPDSRIDRDLFNGGQILSYEFRDHVRAGKVNAVKGSIARFTKTGVVLTDGTEMEADVIVFGTGFKKSYSYLDARMKQRLNRQS